MFKKTLLGILTIAILHIPQIAHAVELFNPSVTPQQQASFDLNGVVGMGSGFAVSSALALSDIGSPKVHTEKQIFFMTTGVVAMEFAAMEAYTYGEGVPSNRTSSPHEANRIGWYKTEQVGYGVCGSMVATLPILFVHHTAIVLTPHTVGFQVAF